MPAPRAARHRPRAAEAATGARAVVITGEAGIGKTRLCREFHYRLFDRESTKWRRVLHRLARHQAKRAIRSGAEPPRQRRTSGWNTW